MTTAGSEDAQDDDLKRAIAMSLKPEALLGAGASPERQSCCAAEFSGLAGLGRAAMERERLARLASRKRDRSISPPPARSLRKAPKLEETTLPLPSGANLKTFSTLVQAEQDSRKSSIANAANEQLKKQPSGRERSLELQSRNLPAPSTTKSSDLQYPNGVVKKTWAFGHERDGNDVKLEEVLEPLTLKTAVLSAFQWDTDWVLAKLKTPLNGGITKCVFVMQEKDSAKREQMLRNTEEARSFLRLCFPSMAGQINCMHSKLMLLFHQHKLRIGLPTANLLNFDWGETGQMENSCFMIDLPRLPNESKVNVESLTVFGKELLYFIQKQGLDQDVVNGSLNFDFSATAGMAFVHTVGGASWNDEAARTGLLGLSRAVSALDLRAGGDLELDFAASSIGALNDDFLRAVHAAARGEHPIAESAAAPANPAAKADFFKPAAKKAPSETKSIRNKMRIYFPTHETVRSSTAGSAGTICLSRRYYENMSFPRSCFRDYISVRAGLISHNKILYARGNCRIDNGKQRNVAWVYVGSANMSESAWGKVLYDKKEKKWKINCRNWECGVLLPVPPVKLESMSTDGGMTVNHNGDGQAPKMKSEGEAFTTPASVVEMSVFKDLVDLPFEYPGATYGDREPWYFQERL